MANNDSTPEFAGGIDEKMDPRDFLKKIKLSFRKWNVDENKQVEEFGLYLKTDSEAEEWYNALASPENNNFTNLAAAFTNRFPATPKAKPTKAELERELINARLKPEELGKKDENGVYTHIAFADKLLRLATAASIHATSSSIISVRESLPRIIREKVKEEQTNWTGFVTEIKGVGIEHIRDGVAKEDEKRKEMEELERRLTNKFTQATPPNTPSKSLARSFASASLQSPSRPQRTNSRNPFNSLPTPASLSDADRTTLRSNLNSLPHHPNTAEGLAAYQKQCQDWARTWGKDQRVTFQTPFPLTPGTLPVLSGECFRCAKGQHRGLECNEIPGIPTKESEWRRLCFRELKAPRSTAVNVVALSDNEDDFSWMFARGVDKLSQGNGEGSSA
jgi:hypothetical protein